MQLGHVGARVSLPALKNGSVTHCCLLYPLVKLEQGRDGPQVPSLSRARWESQLPWCLNLIPRELLSTHQHRLQKGRTAQGPIYLVQV